MKTSCYKRLRDWVCLKRGRKAHLKLKNSKTNKEKNKNLICIIESSRLRERNPSRFENCSIIVCI